MSKPQLNTSSGAKAHDSNLNMSAHRPPFRKAASYRVATRPVTSPSTRRSSELSPRTEPRSGMTSPRMWEMLVGSSSNTGQSKAEPKSEWEQRDNEEVRKELVKPLFPPPTSQSSKVGAPKHGRSRGETPPLFQTLPSTKEGDENGDTDDDLLSLGSAKDHITTVLKDAELRFHLNNVSSSSLMESRLEFRESSLIFQETNF